jgi:hypothetical protein
VRRRKYRADDKKRMTIIEIERERRGGDGEKGEDRWGGGGRENR